MCSMNGQDRGSGGIARGANGSCAIGVMAKVPRPGHSKTRLCPPLRAEQASALSAAFVRDTTTNVARAAQSTPIVGYAAYAPSGTEDALLPHLAQGTVCVLADGSAPAPQGVEGFGRCLLHAIRQMLAAGHDAACVLSSDTPTLPTAFLITAATALLVGDDRRVVLGACNDGGYYLLGMRVPYARLFADVVWSTDRVAAATRTRAAELDLDLVELPPWYDIDDAASLKRLMRDNNGYDALWTRRALQALGRDAFTSAASAA